MRSVAKSRTANVSAPWICAAACSLLAFAPLADLGASQANSNAPEREGLAAPDHSVIPASAEQFDLVCQEARRTIASPPWQPGVRPKLERERTPSRQIVDLVARKSCFPAWCQGAAGIAGISPERITLYESPRGWAYVRRSDGYFQDWDWNGGSIITLEGYCRRDSFSGFPARHSREGKWEREDFQSGEPHPVMTHDEAGAANIETDRAS